MRVKLKDITKFSKGTQINGKNLIDDGAYSYLNGGINLLVNGMSSMLLKIQ